MELYQRLASLINARYERSAAKLAEQLGIHPNTFRGYLTEEGQEKIRFSVLTRILEITPGLSREWLFFGEGQMFGGGETGIEEPASCDKTIPTPVTDAIRKAEIALRQAGASEQSVWVAVQSLARDRLG